MFGRFEKFVGLGGLVAVALCLGFPVGWNAFFPEFAAEIATVRLTRPRSADVLDLPAGALDARQIEFQTRETEQLLVFGVEVPRAGIYSVYGISANRHAQPLELRVNGRAVSANAFYQKTGKMREGFERHLIARGVRFRPGENSVMVAGGRAMFRTLVLELHREIPLKPLRYLSLVAVAAALLMVRHVLVRRMRIPPRLRLVVAGTLLAAGLALLPAIWFEVSDGELIPLGYKDPIKTGRLQQLEQRLNSEKHRLSVDEKFNVFVMGDSTHFWSLPTGAHLVDQIQRILAEQSHEDVEVDGLAGGALNAFDFYLLLNRIVRESPDLVVIPLSLRSFSDRWLRNPGYQFHGMDHYLSPAEFFRARNLAVAGREISTIEWLLRRIDAGCCGGDAAHLLRGVRTYFFAEKERIERRIERTAFATWTPVPAELQLKTKTWHNAWNSNIAPDHPLLEAFRLINDLAARHGIELLYYTEQVNVTAQRKKGNEVRVVENFATLEAAVAGGPGVHFLMLSDRNPPEIFSDDVDHLTSEGVATLAGTLVQEILALRESHRVNPSAPGEQSRSSSDHAPIADVTE